MANRYWVGGTGNWSDATNHWSDSTGGTPNASFLPTASDDVFFDTNSHNNNYTVTIDATTRVCNSFNTTVPSVGNMTLAGNQALNISGSFSIYSGMVNTYTGAITFNSAITGNTITTNGVTLDSAIIFNGGGSWTLQGVFTTLKGITTTSGTLNTNNYDLYSLAISNSNSNNRTINMGSSTWYITGNNATVINMTTTSNLTITHTTGLFNLNYSGSVGTRTVVSTATNQRTSIRISAGTDTLLQSTYQAKDFDFTGFAGTWTGNSTLVLAGNFTISSGMTCNTNGSFEFRDNSGQIKYFTSNGKSIGSTGFYIDAPSGYLKFPDNLSASGMIVGLNRGTLDFENQSISLSRLLMASAGGTGANLNIKNCNLTIHGTGINFNADPTSTIMASGSTITINNTTSTSKSINTSGFVLNDIYFTGDNINILGNAQYNNMYINNAGLTSGLVLQAGSTVTITGQVSSNGSVGNLTRIISSSSGSQANINKFDKNVILNYSNIKDINASGGCIYYAPNSTDGGNNNGIIFSTPSIIDNINGVNYANTANVNGVVKANLRTFVNHR